jgi:energy-coupling factor transport system permease protein
LRFHPATKILGLILIAIGVYQLSPIQMTFLAVCLFAATLLYSFKPWFLMLKRMRWLFLSMFLIYAFNTPGEFVRDWPLNGWVDLSPTYEGLQAGTLQLVRLMMMLAGVALMLATTTTSSMIEGFYILLKPLKYIGLHPERFAARLCLTLHYIESNNLQQDRQSASYLNWQQFLNMDLDKIDTSSNLKVITLENHRLSYLDYMALFVMCALLIWKW